MLLILMRHGVAADLSDAIRDDFSRPLTEEGRVKTQSVARGLQRLIETIDLLASSPKTRARQTAQIVRDVFGNSSPEISIWDELAESETEVLIQKLAKTRAQTVVLVGHEPDLGFCAARLLNGDEFGFRLDWKKAGACGIEWDGETQSAVLKWFLPPAVLRALGAGN